ncbi:hypothetical protein FSP39_019093 [Pinctada imbricata]|uniref:Mitochondria-eating protein C-terminal domain-containing protein n=1 Tax=Pinctada imbricata TaxID=66713 RepID=A0AA89BXN9_PINIB|nr:hypothetical protein FSP39_019093 [Pinctada imbricata]
MSVDIYPKECKEEWRDSITTLLSSLEGRDAVVSSNMLARGSTHYVELMMTEKKMKTHNPQMDTGSDLPPEYEETKVLTETKEAHDRSLQPGEQFLSAGLPPSNVGANSPRINKKSGTQKSKGAMGELPQPGDNDPRIKWRGAYEDLHRSWLYQQSQISELTSRLSSFASKQLTDGNPNFTDLSDRNRPTKIGEKFGTVFDDEWSEAFEEIKAILGKDDVCIDCLLNIVKLSYGYCERIASQQLEALKNSMLIPVIHPFSFGQDTQLKHLTRAEQKLIDSATTKHAKEYRKVTAMASVQDVCKKFFNEESLKKLLKDNLTKPKIKDYVERTTEHLWLMVVQDPPMYLEFANKGNPVNKELFRFYDKKGKIVERTIWPVVYLHKGGPVISKGYVYPQ